MSANFKILLCCVLILFFCESVLSQDRQTPIAPTDKLQNPNKKAGIDKSKKVLSQQQQRALELIGVLSDKAKSLENQKSKIRIRLLIADLLWKFDEPQARTLFNSTFEEANLAFTNSQKEAQSKQQSPTIPSEFQLLSTTLNAIAQHDKDWAESLRKNVPDNKVLMNQGSQNILSLQMALSLIETNPESATQIAIASLNNGFSPMIGSVLHQLQHKNPVLAEQVFIKALYAAQPDPGNAYINIRVLAPFVFPSIDPHSSEDLLGQNRDTPTVNTILINH